MRPYDLKRAFGHVYRPSKSPALVEVPSLAYIAVDGEGDSSDQAYEDAVGVLFDISSILKEASSNDGRHRPFTIAPLECVWSAIEVENRETWSWSAMIAQPAWLDEQAFLQARDQVSFKEGMNCNDVRLCTYEDGLCVTMLHEGSYEDEAASFAAMEAFCERNRLRRISDAHREIYLGTYKKTKDASLKTILRFQVQRW